MRKTKTVKLSEFAPEMSGDGSDFGLPLLPLDQNLAVVGARVSEGNLGKYAVITLEDGIQFRTSSKVLVERFEKIADKFDGKTTVWMRATRATSQAGRSYYTLTDPVEE